MAMKDSYKTAGDVYLDRLSKTKPADYRRFRRISTGKESIVVSGAHDHAQDVLNAMRIEYQLVDARDFCQIDLPNDRPVIVNCGSKFGGRQIERIRSHVKGGGTIVTTDWALRDLVERAFPGYIKYNGRSTADDVVTVELTRTGKTLLPDVIGVNDEPRWWLEGSSHPIKIVDEDNVEVLIRSDEMRDKYGESPIVVRFPFGAGMVYHLVSHIYLQRAEERNVRQQQNATEFVKAKGGDLGGMRLREDQTVGEMEAAYLSVSLMAHILSTANDQRKERESA